jgi:hypothetical protein
MNANKDSIKRIFVKNGMAIAIPLNAKISSMMPVRKKMVAIKMKKFKDLMIAFMN